MSGELAKAGEGGQELQGSVYGDFVLGVATREIAKAHNVDPFRTARIFKSGGAGEEEVHLVGEGSVVKELADVLERGGYRVKEWHVRRPADLVKEAERVRPALRELLEGLPVPLRDSLPEFLGKLAVLPQKAGAAAQEAVQEVVERLVGRPAQPQGRDGPAARQPGGAGGGGAEPGGGQSLGGTDGEGPAHAGAALSGAGARGSRVRASAAGRGGGGSAYPAGG
jgi:hypothetical protein